MKKKSIKKKNLSNKSKNAKFLDFKNLFGGS